MIKKILDVLHGLNGAAYLERRLDSLRVDLHEQIGRLRGEVRAQSLVSRYLGLEAPLYLLRDGRPAFHPCQTESGQRVIVISIPKSGTYLLSAILEKLGMFSAGVHLWETGFHDYRGRTIPEMIHKYQEFAANLSLAESVDLLLPGQFAVGHISYSADTSQFLAPLRRVLSVRDLRAALVSHMRWFSHEGRGITRPTDWKAIEKPQERMILFLQLFGEELLGIARRVSDWRNDVGTLVVRFETLLGDDGEDAQHEVVARIAAQAGIELSSEALREVLSDVLNKPTKTWSGRRSEISEFWSDDSEELFVELGGAALNSGLGY